jgi:ATPase subunit of ABC transporter with duplicated ATPase domains
MHLNTIVEINSVSFDFLNGHKIFDGLNLSIIEQAKTGLVGSNGSGKSTLFKLINGELNPTDGYVKRYGKISYVPQINLDALKSDLTLQEYLTFKNENYWEIYSILNESFDFNHDLGIKIKNLSGGELMKINIASALSEEPDLLLLDEPTNHLDVFSVQKIIKILDEINIAFIVVSHDIFFLNQIVNAIWEIENKSIKIYGGNYADFKEQKELELESKRKIVESAQNKLKRVNALQQKEIQRTNRNAKNRRELYLKGSIGSWEYVGGERGRGSMSSAFVQKVHKMTAEAQADIENNKTSQRKLASISIKNPNQKAGQTLIHTENLDVGVGSEILIKNLSFDISYGERISIAGKNGSGKTILVKNLISKDENIYQKQNLKYLYIDQHYSLIDFDKTIIGNMQDYLLGITESQIKELLGKMRFGDISDHKKLTSTLSGGELSRLSFAIVGALPIELLILDEPTNNLDVETIEIMIEALNKYNGSLIIISHNIDFLSKINIEESYLIKNQRLKKMHSLPSNQNEYYNELFGI